MRSVVICTVLAVWTLVSSDSAEAIDRPEIITYGESVPVKTLGGEDFVSPFTSRDCPRWNPWEGRCAVRWDKTVIEFEEVDGLRHPFGATSWGLAGFGRYVLVGNMEQGGGGVAVLSQTPIVLADQQIGIFDTEEKRFCVLDLDPLQSRSRLLGAKLRSKEDRGVQTFRCLQR